MEQHRHLSELLGCIRTCDDALELLSSLTNKGIYLEFFDKIEKNIDSASKSIREIQDIIRKMGDDHEA